MRSKILQATILHPLCPISFQLSLWKLGLGEAHRFRTGEKFPDTCNYSYCLFIK